MQLSLEVMVGLDAHPQGVRERLRADRHDHVLLEVDQVVSVHATVEHVEHRHREHRRFVLLTPGTTTAAAQRVRRAHTRPRVTRPGCAFAPSRDLVLGPVELDQRTVEAGLVGRSCDPQSRGRFRRLRSRPRSSLLARRTPRRRHAARPPRAHRWRRPTEPPRARTRPIPSAHRPPRSGCRGCQGFVGRAPG